MTDPLSAWSTDVMMKTIIWADFILKKKIFRNQNYVRVYAAVVFYLLKHTGIHRFSVSSSAKKLTDI